jgi:hypothetical protein
MRRQFYSLFDKIAKKHVSDPLKYPAPKRCTWPALRHFAMSTWIEAGLFPTAVQTMLIRLLAEPPGLVPLKFCASKLELNNERQASDGM